MIERARSYLIRILRWSEKFTKTDMVYLASGGFWLVFEQIMAAIFAFALAVAFGHFASKDLYGNYKYVLSLASVLTAFSLSGIGTAVTQAAARGKEGTLKQGFTINLRWSVPMSLISLGVGGFYFFQGNSFVALSMWVVALFSPFLYSFSLFDNFLIGLRKFDRVALYSVVINFASMIILILALFAGHRAIVLVIAYFAINTTTAALFYIRTQQQASNDATDPEMLKYGFHLSIMGILSAIADKVDSIAVFTLLGPAQLATYTYAIAMPEQIKGFTKNIVPLAMPKFAQRSISEIKRGIWRRILVLGVGLITVIALYIFFAPFIFRIFFPVYLGSVYYSQVYALSLIFTLSTPLIAIFQGHKKMKELYISSNIGSMVLIIVLPLLTYFWGIPGALVSIICSRFINMIVTCYLFFKLTV